MDMSHYNWFHNYIRNKHKSLSNEDRLNDLFELLEFRSKEYLEHNNEVYKKLYISSNDSVINCEPQIIQQVKDELFYFLLLLMENKTESILQIGLGHFGSTQFLLSFICKKIVTIEKNLSFINQYKQRELVFNENIEFFIYGDSTNKEVIKKAEFNGPYDCIFIDGNHSYEYALKDFNNYYPMLKQNGICAFHDVLFLGERYEIPKVLETINKEVSYINYSKEIGYAYFYKQ